MVLKDYFVPLASNKIKAWQNNKYIKKLSLVTSDFRQVPVVSKVNISFVMSVHLSIWNNLTPTEQISVKFYVGKFD